MVNLVVRLVGLFCAFAVTCGTVFAEYPSSNLKVLSKAKNPHFYLARKYSEERKYDLAKAEFSILIESEPAEPSYRLSRSEIEIRLKDYRGALADAEKALSLTDNAYKKDLAYIMRARAFAGLNKTDKAISEFAEVLKRQPTEPAAQLDLGKLLLKTKRYDEALARLQLARSQFQRMHATFAQERLEETDQLIAQVEELQSKSKRKKTAGKNVE